MSKNKNGKITAERIHAKKRFLERYGLVFSKEVRLKFERLIRCHQSCIVEKQSNRISVHDVIYNGEVYRVVYDKNRKTIVTALPPEKQVVKSL